MRAFERARFIVATARESGVELALVGRVRDRCAFAYAPTATSRRRQLDCQRSFRNAVEDNAYALTCFGARPRGRA